jgi:cation diffusion facilitator CzcD-associated flavoprotein CzcO
MSKASRRTAPAPKTASPIHVDVLIVGAGLSGVGSAYHLKTRLPDRTFVVLEMAETYGGTWWWHTYPGIRSDSDLHTFGYSFKAWRGPPIATAEEIRSYMGEVIAEHGLSEHIRYRHKIMSAAWSSETNRWTLEVERTDTGEQLTYTCGFLWMCQGYYRHGAGHMPRWDGVETFRGRLVHSEEWTGDIDYADKRVVVIGSGASAATIVPAMAPTARHVTMLQRSPTFFLTGRNAIEITEQLRKLGVQEDWIHEITRRQMLLNQSDFTKRCFAEPEKVAGELIGVLRGIVGDKIDVDAHFTPRYLPWRQRIAYVPEADLFKALGSGRASVVTDEIARFVPEGIELVSGQVLDADLVVAATGFHLAALGDVPFTIDGRPLDLAETVTWHGMMFTGVPNLAWVFGYFRASWTLRVDLVADVVCRLLAHMAALGAARVDVTLRPEDRDMALGPWVDPADFNPGYVQRGMHLLPKSGGKREWRHSQDYWSDKDTFPAMDLNDPAFVYTPLAPKRSAAAAS